MCFGHGFWKWLRQGVAYARLITRKSVALQKGAQRYQALSASPKYEIATQPFHEPSKPNSPKNPLSSFFRGLGLGFRV